MPHTMHHLLREHHILMNTVKKDKPDMLGGIINEMIDFNQFTIALVRILYIVLHREIGLN